MNLYLIGGGILVLLYWSRTANAASSTGLPTGLPFPTGTYTSAPGAQPYNSDSLYQAGQALSDITGDPTYGTVGSDAATLFGAFSSPTKGARQKQENDLVQKYQNPLVNQYFAQISTAWNRAVQNGTATNQMREQVKSMIQTAAARFYAIAQSYPLSGPGGIRTIQNFVNNTFIPSIDAVPLTS